MFGKTTMNEASWHWNAALFERIHATGASPDWLVGAGRVLAEAPLLAAGLLTLWLAWRQDDARFAVRIVLACILVPGTETLVGLFADQPRPFEAGIGVAWLAHAANNAMPSTHVGLVWAAAVASLIGGHRRMGAVLLVLGTAMGWARIYVGLQWPADIVASALAACGAVAGSLGLEASAGLLRGYPRRSARTSH
jgi:undecaprenyl-diphosphatase